MLKINMDIVNELNLNIDDVCLIAGIEDIFDFKGADSSCIISYKEIIDDLPILFNSTEKSNIVKLRNMLEREGIKSLITKTIKQQGRGKGALVTFTMDRQKVKELNVKGILN